MPLKRLSDLRQNKSSLQRKNSHSFVLKYQIVRPDGTLEKEIPLELRAGFVGAVEDTLTNTLTPKIGWFVHEAIEEPKKDGK